MKIYQVYKVGAHSFQHNRLKINNLKNLMLNVQMLCINSQKLGHLLQK